MNSIWTFSPAPMSLRAYPASPSSTTSVSVSWSQPGREVEVHEPGPGHLDRGQMGRRVGAEMLGQLLGDLAGRASQCLGVDQGGIGRPVPVVAAGGTLEMDRGGVDVDPHGRQVLGSRQRR